MKSYFCSMNPIKISEKALNEIKDIFNNKNIPENYGLRIASKGSGCAGIEYIIGFDQKTDEDEQYDDHGIKIIINKKDFMHLIGVEVDFIDDNDERGFVFN